MINKMKKTMVYVALSSIFVLQGCASIDKRNIENENHLKNNIQKNLEEENNRLKQELLMNKRVEESIKQKNEPEKIEKKLNINIKDTSIQTMLPALLEGTDYNIIFPEEINEKITIKLKNVTLFEILETLKNIYNYDYEIKNRSIVFYPNRVMTKIYQINHLVGKRKGSSELKVSNNSMKDNGNSNNSLNNVTSTSNFNSTNPNFSTTEERENSKVTTTVENNFWDELQISLNTIISRTKDVSIVVSPQTNTVLVKAKSKEQQEIQKYLSIIQGVVDRQVVIEAKIIEVELKNGSETGINWALLKRNNKDERAILGFTSPNSSVTNTQIMNSGNNVSVSPGFGIDTGNLSQAANGILSLAFQTDKFATILSFLETQGNLQVLSSPRIATLNNQKSVLKVGTDEFFVTNVSVSTTSSTTGNVSTPSVATQPFFSGIALDITPQIGEDGNVMMHVKPSISQVTTVTKDINLGQLGSITLPLASNTISESDSIVKVPNNQLVAIGGLMKQYMKNSKTQLPEVSNIPVVGNAFKNTNSNFAKYELVILLKPQIVETNNDWDKMLKDVRDRLKDFSPKYSEIKIEKDNVEYIQ